MIKSRNSRIALLLFLVWEAWWAYEFFTAPIPDEEMITVFAFLMGVVLPGIVIGLPASIYLVLQIVRHSRHPND